MQLSMRLDKENNREYAYRTLRDNIMKLQILPGATINEGELSELLNVSRTPVHEAVLMLKEESLIEVYPQSGSKVSLINLDVLKEGNFVRSVLEPEIIRQMAGNMPREQMERLKENLERQQAALETEDPIDRFFKLDDQFHRMIYEHSGKNKTWYAMKRVSTHYDRVRYLDAIMNHTNLGEIMRQHQKIFHILLVGCSVDFDLKIFYEGHLGTYRRYFQEILEKYPEYFAL